MRRIEYYLIKTNVSVKINSRNSYYDFDELINYDFFKKCIKCCKKNKKSLTDFQNELIFDMDVGRFIISNIYLKNNINYMACVDEFKEMIKTLHKLNYPNGLIKYGLFLSIGTVEGINDIIYFMNYFSNYINVKQKILENNSLEFICIKRMILYGKSNEIPMYLKEKYDYIKY